MTKGEIAHLFDSFTFNYGVLSIYLHRQFSNGYNNSKIFFLCNISYHRIYSKKGKTIRKYCGTQILLNWGFYKDNDKLSFAAYFMFVGNG